MPFPLPFLAEKDQDQVIFYGFTLFAAIWWGWQLVRLPGTWNELKQRFRELGTGKSFLPLIMQLIFTFVWWVIPLIPILVYYPRYMRYYTYVVKPWLGGLF